MMLIIRASLLSSYGKNVAKLHYEPKYPQFAKIFYTSLNVRVDLVFQCFSSQSHFRAVTVKILLNPITAHKTANLQNNVGRLIIIILSFSYNSYLQSVTFKLLWQKCRQTPKPKPKVKKFNKTILHVSKSSFSPFFVVFSIIVTFWSSHGEIEAYYCPQESQFARHCQTPHNNPSQLFFSSISSERRFGALTVKISDPRLDQKDDQCARYCHTRFNLQIHLVLLCLSLKRHFGTLALKILFNPITKEMMTNLQNTIKRFGIIVFRKCFATDHHSAVLELLLLNQRQPKFWPKIWPISKTLSQAFYSPYSAGLFVRIM